LETDPNEHIGTVELAKLLEESRRRAESAPDAADMHPHLAACPACREQFEDLALLDRQLDRQMKSMRSAESPPRQGDCPGPVVWREIAGGLTLPGETLIYLDHASRCDLCGPLLREAVAEVSDLNGEITEAERTLIAILDSARAEWQQRLAKQITETPHPAPNRDSTPWWKRWLAIPRLAVPSLAVPRLAMAGASLLAIVAAGSWVVVHRYNNYIAARNQPAAAVQLLARAYTEKRTLELRIAGADYAPLRVSRGPAASFTSRPEPLLKAEALIASQLESHPSDPSWLQAKAQADVLEGKYDAAVEALRRALELQPHSPALLTDLATAYFQRAQQEDRKDDLGAAYEYLSQALRFHPDDPVALFNRAIVAEHQFLYHQALDDWDRYLQVDPRSEWTGEAREATDRLRTKLKDHDASQVAPLLSPAQIAASIAASADAASADAASGDDPNLRSAVDARIEEYLSVAVRSWLPQAYPEKGAADPASQRALFFLADLTSQQHNDRWLADLLRGSSARNFPQAVAALGRAVNATEIAEYDVSRRQAELAEQLFRASGNTAGMLRAQFERSYTAQATRRSEACRQRATNALTGSEKYPYPWLQIRLELEEGICSGIMSDLGTQEKMAQRAMGQAQNHWYGGLYLRSLYFAADEKMVVGDRPSAWRLSLTGLQRYWSGQYPGIQAYNLSGGLAFEAGSHDQVNLQLALWGEAIAELASDANLLRRATTHELLARAAIVAHESRLAEQHYAEAERLYSRAPQTEASRWNAIESQIRNAQLESRQGKLENALGRLISVQDQIRPLSNNYLVQMFYSVLGELQLRRHREAEAEQALQPALTLAEQSLASLKSEAERIPWKNDAAPVYLALTEAKLLQGGSQESLDVYERYLGASQRAALDRRAPSQLVSRLPLLSRETVLVYAALPDGLSIWICDDRGVHAEWIAKPTEELQELAARFYDLASDPKSDLRALRRDGRSLYTSLILPIEQRLAPGRTLVIEADGWLGRVPFEALVDAQNHYLIERWPVVHSLGQDFEARLRNDIDDNGNYNNDAGPISARMPLLVVASAASSQEQGLPPLTGIAEEADAVASGFHSPRVLKGSEATLRAVKEDLPSAAIFHFAGHSLVTPDRSGLLLENANAGSRTETPSLLDAAAVRKLNVGNMELAFLSACNTESGAGSSGGFNSVTEALLRAGVPHVVASRWEVVETRAFINDFYRSALSGQPVSEAIRRASRNMLADPRTAHPYYWSAFAAYGRP
jgi:CHAT domain-containing protein/cytochrome c-type biogenesis protein CcmH/NrfG